MPSTVRSAGCDRKLARAARTRERAAFLAGVMTAVCVALVLVVVVVDRVGCSVVLAQLSKAFLPGQWRRERILRIPAALLDELAAVEAVVDNTNNPTKAVRHHTILVRPDHELGYMPRPGVAIAAYVLKANDALNLDPPILYVRAGTKLSAAARRFIAAHQRGQFACTINGQGLRTTIPAVAAERRLLMVGDSVCFGLGVNDDATIASFLQQRIGRQVQVLNAGVGGFNASQAGKMAARLADAAVYDLLVYVACENDFGHRAETAPEVLAPFAQVRRRFADRVLVLFVPYVEYVMNDVLGHYGFAPDTVRRVDELRAELPKLCHTLGLQYLDFTDVILAHKQRRGTIFAGFDLYVDHCHLAPAGNELAAVALAAALRKDWNHVATKHRPLGNPIDRPDQSGRHSADQEPRVHHAVRHRQP